MKVRSASGAAQPGAVSRRLEAALIWRVNGLTWRLEGGACEPPRRAATTGGAGALCMVRKRLCSSSQGATEAADNLSGHRTCRKAGAKAWSSLAPALVLMTGVDGAPLIAG